MPKPLLALLTAVGLISLALLITTAASAQTSGGGRPPMFTPGPVTGGPATTPVPGLPTPPPGSIPSKAAPQFMPVSLFGMNLYLTGLERSNAQAGTARRTGRAGRRQVVAGRAVLGQHRAEREGPVQLGTLRQPPGL